MMGEDLGVTFDAAHPGSVLKLKAGEVSVISRFALHALRKFGEDLTHFLYLERAGTALEDFFDILHTAPTKMSLHEQSQLMVATQQHLLDSQRSGIRLLPKHHLTVHLSQRIFFVANKNVGGIAFQTCALCCCSRRLRAN
jgi:hypothetical protein